MPNKLTSLTGFGEGDPKPEKKGAKAKALSAKMGKKHFEHLVSARDSRANLRKEHDYWKATKGKKNLRISSEPSGGGNYTSRIEVRKGH